MTTAVIAGRVDENETRWRGPACAVLVAAALSVLAIVGHWRGADLAAQVYRIGLFREHGFLLWNNLWFGGHPTLDYSVLVPVLGAVTGAVLLGALASVVSAFFVDRLLRGYFGPQAVVGSLFFAVSTVTNLAVGRVTFGVGVAFGVAALWALQRDRGWTAAVLAGLSSMSSPVAGAFVAIAVLAWTSRARRRWPVGAGVLAATIAPLAIVARLFPTAGTFPFELWLFAVTLGASAAVIVVVPRHHVVLRRATAFYALACAVDFTIPNPLGGNIVRLALYGAGPILACVLWPARRILLTLVALPLLVWQWYPAVDGIALAAGDVSTSASYYVPLLDFVHSQPGGPSRLEIPSTRHHWESVYVGATESLARGWERQLDMGYNRIFYNGTLSAASYQEWLSDMGVRYVALPRAPLDDTAVVEARLLDAGLPYLSPVWQNADWRVWRYDSSPGLIEGPASLVQIAPASFTVHVEDQGDILVRLRASSHWSVSGPGCVSADPSGWTVLRGLPIGTVRVEQALQGTACS